VVARRSWLLIAEVALVGVLAALAFPSDGSGYISAHSVSLTATGPSPSTLKLHGGEYMLFDNKDSVTHTVVFANGLCSLTVAPGEQVGPGNGVNGSEPTNCTTNFPFYVGRYAYTVDGKSHGAVETAPASRSVTLTARTHRIRRGERLTLRGQVMWDNNATSLATEAPFPVIVLARHAGSHTFKAIATVAMAGSPDAHDIWHLKVRPEIATTYIAEVNRQLPGGRIWKQATSHPFPVRMRR
jgi:plastocyanin